MFTLAHLSDPHLPPLPWPGLRPLIGKRALGYLNWIRLRRRIHRRDILARIVADLHAQAPDHIACTGDLVNISLPREYGPARDWLTSLGDARDVTLVPGNHDAYVRGFADGPVRHWGDYVRGDDGGSFPFLRRRGPIALIGLSSAVPTSLLMSSGSVGEAQLAALPALLAQAQNEGLFRVVMIHHPPRRSAPVHQQLTDAPALRTLIAPLGAELILHGHDHLNIVEELETPRGPLLMVGVPSASASPVSEEAAGYNLYRIDGGPGRWTCEVISRGLRDDAIVETARTTVVIPGRA